MAVNILGIVRWNLKGQIVYEIVFNNCDYTVMNDGSVLYFWEL